MYRNREGYSDPTAGAAMGKVMAEYYRQHPGARKKERRRANRQKKLARMKHSADRSVTQNPKEEDCHDR